MIQARVVCRCADPMGLREVYERTLKDKCDLMQTKEWASEKQSEIAMHKLVLHQVLGETLANCNDYENKGTRLLKEIKDTIWNYGLGFTLPKFGQLLLSFVFSFSKSQEQTLPPSAIKATERKSWYWYLRVCLFFFLLFFKPWLFLQVGCLFLSSFAMAEWKFWFTLWFACLKNFRSVN